MKYHPAGICVFQPFASGSVNSVTSVSLSMFAILMVVGGTDHDDDDDEAVRDDGVVFGLGLTTAGVDALLRLDKLYCSRVMGTTCRGFLHSTSTLTGSSI